MSIAVGLAIGALVACLLTILAGGRVYYGDPDEKIYCYKCKRRIAPIMWSKHIRDSHQPGQTISIAARRSAFRRIK